MEAEEQSMRAHLLWLSHDEAERVRILGRGAGKAAVTSWSRQAKEAEMTRAYEEELRTRRIQEERRRDMDRIRCAARP